MAELPFTLKNPDIFRDQSYVNGSWVEAKSGKRFNVVDPGSEKIWASAPDNDEEDVTIAVQAAVTAFQSYKKVNPRQRAKWLLQWDSLISANKEDLANILVYETGKPFLEAIAEIDYALTFTWWFAGEAERIFGTVQTSAAPGRRVFTIKQPVGVTAALVPWNFPVALVVRKASTALAAGCCMIVKPSPETPLSVLTLAYLAEQAGFPKGVFSVLTTSLENTPSLSKALCEHPDIKKVTFTGSTRIGKIVTQMCSGTLKKLTLELGGNCPFLVFDDADLDKAIDSLMGLKWRHAGQACITANRVYVQAGIYEKFSSILVERTKRLKIGHGANTDTTLGPVTTAKSVERATAQVDDARNKGAKILLGGSAVKSVGYFFEPTIILDATAEMLITKEETFAPVLAIYKFETEDEAVSAANNTSMGLASYFFTKDVDRTWRLLENLEAGNIGMNTGSSSAAEAPFGGIKDSGYGKESGKDVAVGQFCITKTGTLTVDGLW